MTNGTGNDAVKYTVIMNKDNTAADMVVVTSGAPSGDTKSVYILSKSVTTAKNAAGDDVYTVPAVVDARYVESLVLDGYNGNGTVKTGLYSVGVIGDSVKYSVLTAANYNDFGKLDGKSVTYVGNVLDGVNVPGKADADPDKAVPFTATLTITGDTKFIIICGSTADKVILDGTADDIIYQVDNDDTKLVDESENNSKVVVSRASNTKTEPGYNMAAYVYIFR